MNSLFLTDVWEREKFFNLKKHKKDKINTIQYIMVDNIINSVSFIDVWD